MTNNSATEDENPKKPASFSEMFAEATGEEIDIDHVELQLKFALELQGLKESRSAQLGYVLIDREGLSNVAIVFSTPVKAAQALDNHPTIRDLIGDGYLTIYVPDHVDLALLAGREIILP